MFFVSIKENGFNLITLFFSCPPLIETQLFHAKVQRSQEKLLHNLFALASLREIFLPKNSLY